MLPKEYAWLEQEHAPKILVEALRIYGVKEVPGEEDNPVILSWAKEVGISNYYHDEVPWCGLAMAVIVKRADKQVVDTPLWAKSWAKFGVKVTDGAQLGDILVFVRQGGGHVGVYVGEDETSYHVLGGNQKDAVSIVRISKQRIYAIRRPDYKVKPENVRKILLHSNGDVSMNEN